MKDWYALTNELETPAAPLDEVRELRIRKRVQAALRRKKRRIPLAAAIAAVLLLTACGVAAATGQFSRWFWNISGNYLVPEQSEDLFAELGTVIGQSQTAEGVTLTLDGALWDGTYLYLSLSVEGLDSPADHWAGVESGDSWLGSSYEQNIQSCWAFYDALPPEQQQTYAATREAARELFDAAWDASRRFCAPEIDYLYNRRGGDCRLQVSKKLESAQEQPAELTLHLENLELGQTTVKGPFDFTFTLTPKPMTLTYTGDLTLDVGEGIAIRVSEVRVSPFQVEVDFTALTGEDQIDLDVLRIGTLRTVAGETTGSPSSGLHTMQSEDGSTCYTLTDGPFRQIVDPRAITDVELGGVWLELSELKLQN